MDIHTLANRAHKICKKYAFSYSARDYLFHKRHDLRCMCCIASFFFDALVEQKMPHCKRKVICACDGPWGRHVFNLIDDSIIVDITAAQFDQLKFLRGPYLGAKDSTTKVLNNYYGTKMGFRTVKSIHDTPFPEDHGTIEDVSCLLTDYRTRYKT